MARSGVRMRLVGARELEANLLELPRRLQSGTLTRALRRVAEPIGDAAKRNRGEGDLADKIIVARQLSRRQRRQRGRAAPGTKTIYVGVRPSRHAHLVEFGTGPRYTKSGAYRGMMPAQPFMRPAWDSQGGRKALDRLGVILGQEIEATARRLARRRARGTAAR